MKRGARVLSIIVVAAIITCFEWAGMALPLSATAIEGPNNTIYGQLSGGAISGGTGNSLFGVFTGVNLQGGSNNTFLGYQAGYYTDLYATNASENTFVGYSAGQNVINGHNTFVGFEAGFGASGAATSDHTGYYNTFIGNKAGYNNTSGQNNTFLGYYSGLGNTTGNFNTAVGYQAGQNNSGGGLNVFLGYQAGYSETGSNKLYISNSSSSTPLIYGDFFSGTLKVYGTMIVDSIGGPSDERYKKDIHPLTASLDKIMKLQGVSFLWKDTGSKRGFRQGRQIGLIAQNVESVLPELVLTDENGYKAVAYDKLVPVLVEAVKEQQAVHKSEMEAQQKQLQDKDVEIQALKKAILDITSRLAALESSGKTVAVK